MGKVAERRAAAKAAGQSMKEYKAANNISTKPKSAEHKAKREGIVGSVAYNRKKAAEAGQTMKEYKAAHGIAKDRAQAFTSNGGSAGFSNFSPERAEAFETYNDRVNDLYEEYRVNNPGSGLVRGGDDSNHLGQFGEDGLLDYGTGKANWQQNEVLKEMGYKAGDMLWRPGSKNINGDYLTGRVDYISEATGNYIPEFVNESKYRNMAYGG